jgi:hypothetical protein
MFIISVRDDEGWKFLVRLHHERSLLGHSFLALHSGELELILVALKEVS